MISSRKYCSRNILSAVMFDFRYEKSNPRVKRSINFLGYFVWVDTVTNDFRSRWMFLRQLFFFQSKDQITAVLLLLVYNWDRSQRASWCDQTLLLMKEADEACPITGPKQIDLVFGFHHETQSLQSNSRNDRSVSVIASRLLFGQIFIITESILTWSVDWNWQSSTRHWFRY